MQEIKVRCNIGRLRYGRTDLCVYSVILIFFVVFLTALDYSDANPAVIGTSYLIGIISLYMAIKPQRSINLKRNIYIFYLIFFFFAPLQQYLAGTRIWVSNGMSLYYDDADYLRTNCMILLSIAAMELGYTHSARTTWLRAKKAKKPAPPVCEPIERSFGMNNTVKRTMNVLLVIATAATVIALGTKGLAFIQTENAIVEQIKHMIVFAPVVCLLVSLIVVKDGYRSCIRYFCFFGLESAAVMLYLSSSLARFLILGAAMAIVSYMLVDSKKRSLYFALYIFGFFFVFSAMRRVDLLSSNVLSFVDFTHMDYDAYQIFMMAEKYVDANGVSYGMNLLSALCCLIPRSIASWRMESTGAILMTFAGSWFQNVSCPVLAEFYFAFGPAGVAVLSLLLGMTVKKLDNLFDRDSYFARGLAAILSGVSIYILRGALLPTFSFTLGLLIAYVVLYYIANRKIKM